MTGIRCSLIFAANNLIQNTSNNICFFQKTKMVMLHVKFYFTRKNAEAADDSVLNAG